MTREEAIRLIKDHIDTYVVCHGEEDTVAVSIDNVDVEAFDMAIKALEQEPQTGHWIVWDTSSYDWTYKCNKCGSIVFKQSNYCPNCGCRMVEPQESEEI